jgi:uncharacterized protein (TIGR02599 family)
LKPLPVHSGKWPFAPRCRGFTLIEILVGTAILVILILALSQIISNVTNIWRIGQSGMERADSGRAVCEIISREMSAALLPLDRTTTKGLQFVVNSSSVDSTYANHDSVFWQAPIGTDMGNTSVAEVGYFVRWDTSTASNPRAILCRFFVNPSDTSNYQIYSSPLSWLTSTMIENVAPATRSSDPPYLGLFMENVLGLWVKCLDGKGATISRQASGTAYSNAYDSRLGYVDSNSTVHPANSLPACVELSFVVIDTTCARRINSGMATTLVSIVRNASGASDCVTQIQASSSLTPLWPGVRPYSTRIYLQNSK